jgi:hypothetical protein
VSPVERCSVCGGLFAFLPRGVCAACLDVRERAFAGVREWLLDNRGASILAASEATGVDEATILSFIREGRLEFVADAAGRAVSPDEEEIKARIRRDLEARVAGSTDPSDADRRAQGMRSRS